MNKISGDFYIIEGFDSIDFDYVADYIIHQTYWGKEKTKDQIIKACKHSLCYSVFDKEHRQVGFARLITDYATVYWVMDVFIDEKYQGFGLGKELFQHILSDPEIQSIKGMLNSRDAREFYQKFGFTSLKYPEDAMERRP